MSGGVRWQTREFDMLIVILCGPLLERHWVPHFYVVVVVEGEGLTTKMTFIPLDLDQG